MRPRVLPPHENGSYDGVGALNEDLFFAALAEGADSPDLDDILNRSRWMKDGLCREHPEVHFHAVQGETLEPAKALSRACLVRAECLDFALSQPSWGDAGVWGGTSPQERKRLRRSAA